MKYVASSLWVYLSPVKWRVFIVYTIVILEALLTGSVGLVSSKLIGMLDQRQAVIMIVSAYILLRYIVVIAMVHLSAVTRTLIKSNVHSSVVKSEWCKGTPSAAILAKLDLSGSIARSIIDDIPDIITTLVTLIVLVLSMYILGPIPTVVVIGVIVGGAIITWVKTKYVTSLHAALYDIEAGKLTIIDKQCSTSLTEWVDTRRANHMKFWWTDTLQGLTQAPIVVLGLMSTLWLTSLTTETFVLVLSVYGTLYYQIDKFANIQESAVHLLLALKKIAKE